MPTKPKVTPPVKPAPPAEPPAVEDVPDCRDSGIGAHEWSKNSTVPFCVWCGVLFEEAGRS